MIQQPRLLEPTGRVVPPQRTALTAFPGVIGTTAVPPLPAEDSVLLDLRQLLVHHWRALFLSIAAGLLLAYLYAMSLTPMYRATATLEIQDLNENFLNMRDVSPVSAIAAASGAGDVQTQLRILKSRTLIARVLERLPAEIIPAPTGVRAWISHGSQGGPAVDPVEAAQRNLQVQETRLSRIVDISYESPDPAYASAFVNRLAQQYIDQSVESRLEISRGTTSWLEQQLADLRNKLGADDKRLQDYAGRTGLLVTTEEHRPDEDKLRQIQESLSKAQENRAVKQARMETSAASPLEPFEIPVGSPLRDHQAKLADLRRQRADLLTVFKPDFDGVKRLDSQIASLETSVASETRALLQGVRNEYSDAVRRENLLQESYREQVGQVAQQAGFAIQYGILKREADATRELYNTMLQRTAEARVATAMRASNARLVDAANAPRLPVSAGRLLILSWGATAGLLFGLVLITARNRMDGSIKKPSDLHTRLNLPELGSIPDVQSLPAGLAPVKSTLVKLPGMEQLARVALETWNNRTGVVASAYRSVLTSLLFSGRTGRSPQLIVVTSATRGEGKTALVSNLAAALAQMKQSVLLVDASENRKLQQVFGQSSNYGIWDVLEMHSEHAGLLPYITNETSLPGVSLVVLGPAGTSVLDLLHADGLGSILQQMRRSFDVVLIDAPAVEERPDARVFARLSDGVVLVVQAGQTTLEATQAVAARLQEDGSLLLGTVLNQHR